MAGKDLGKTSLGLDANVAGLLCYVLGFVTGIIFFVLEKKNKFVRFHALQSIVVFGGLTIIQIILTFIPIINLLTIFVGLFQLVLWIILMIKAYQGEMFKLPIVGDFAEQKI